MADDMIECVARAICRSIDGSEENWLAFTSAAYDALVAMQEPNSRMRQVGGNTRISNVGKTGQGRRGRIGDQAAVDAWGSMIAAAFKGDPVRAGRA